MAHPVRPQSYVEINNFYTPTVYEKGAEVVRMIHTLLGREGFRRGMDLYFKRHDGQAVTTDDFVQCMQDASGVDLAQFRRWYDQAGTPVLEVTDTYDPETRRYTLTVRQSCPPTPGQPDKLPFHIPLVMGLVDATGHDLPLRMEGEPEYQGSSRVLSIREAEQQFTFLAVPARPLPSLLRGFSAPVILRYPYSEANLAHLMAHDRDPFCRWEASQRLATELLLQGVSAVREGQHWAAPESFIRAFAKLLALGRADPAFAAEAMALPSEHYLAEQMEEVDPDALHAVRDSLARQLAASLRPELLSLYHGLADTQAYSPDAASAGRRSLRNLCLAYLVELDDPEVRELAVKQLELSDNMTDALAALTVLANCDCDERIAALASFYAHWQHEPLVVDKWLRAQSSSRMPDALEAVQRLTGHPAFTLRNPNKVYALLGGFALANHVRFHAADGRGYDFMAGQIIELDRLNPQVASRLVRAFDRWRHFEPGRRAHAQTALERIAGTDGMSRDVLEVVTKALA
jgi:aminopeptidase N